MKLYILFGQRKQRYEGEIAPEALEIMDEYSFDDNSSWIDDKLKEYQRTKEFEFLKILVIEINQEQFDRLFFEKEILKGNII